MRIGKRLLALALAAILCFSLVPMVYASNEEGVTYTATVTPKELTVSNEVQTVTVVIRANKEIGFDGIGGTAKIPAGWKLTGVTNDAVTMTSGDYNLDNGLIGFSTENSDIVKSDSIFNLTYEVPANAAAGDYVLGIEELQITRDKGMDTWEDEGVVTATLTIKDAHTHEFNKKVTDEKYQKSAATCTADAVYYYSCECGEKGTATFTAENTRLGHKPAEAWSKDESSHWHVCLNNCGTKLDEAKHNPDHSGHATEAYAITCTECGYVIEEKLDHTHKFILEVAQEKYLKSAATCEKKAVYFKSCSCGKASETDTFEYGGLAPHTWVDVVAVQYIKQGAACETDAQYYKSCKICHRQSEETFTVSGTKLGHDLPDSWKSDANGHWKECQRANCDYTTSKTAHSLTNGVCTICKYGCKHENGTLKWVAKDENTHEQKWSCCGKVEGEATNHAWNDGVCTECGYTCHHDQAGPWDHNEDEHWQVCNTCHKKIKKNVHIGGEATCQAKAVCAVCGTAYGELADHDYDTAWSSNGTQHWYACKTYGCNMKKDAANHFSDKTENKATCAAPAKCDECGVSYGTVNAANHATKLVHHDAVAATCAATGSKEYWSCASCNKNFSDEKGLTVISDAELVVDKDAGKHSNIVEVKAKPHTCTEDGIIAHYKCEGCGKLFRDAKGETEINAADIKDAAAHDLKPVAEKPSTCKVNGTGAYYKCEVCGKLFSDADGKTAITAPTVLPLAEHTWDKVWHANASGHYHECTVCGTAGTVTDHTPGDAATEDTAQTCTECDYIIKPATNHGDKHVKDDSKWVSDTTSHWHACTGCSQQLDKANHTVTNWTVDKEATTSAEGLRHGNCSVCGHVVYETIAKINNGGHGGGGNGGSGSKNDSTKKDDGKKVESGRTFDAGIAMYVGLSVLSVTGGALVIGKKKERF